MENKKFSELKIQNMIYEHLIASMFAGQQRGLAVDMNGLRELISSNILEVTQAYYQTARADQTDQANAEAEAKAEAEALWVEVMGNHHIDRMFGLIQVYLGRD